MAFGRIKNSSNGLDKLQYSPELLSKLNVSSLDMHSAVELDNKENDEETVISFFKLKDEVRASLIDLVDAAKLREIGIEPARLEVSRLVRGIINRRAETITTSMTTLLVDALANDVVGFGPLEPLLARDDISDIMVNGARDVFIEVNGKIEKTNVHFQDNEHLLNVCQRIVSLVGRRVDESSPMCDARLMDGSRVNVIIPPLSVGGPTLTIRKFKKDKLSLADLVEFGSITKDGAELLRIISRVGCNVIVSGGTGSGKTTLLNAMSAFVDDGERIVTCEDAAELQIQKSHVIRLETRPPNLEGTGTVTMRDLVINCLRMRPDRIIVGEVRGAEAFDLIQSMNTGHDGSMGTVHANTPREALRRLETMIIAGGLNLTSRGVREMIVGSIDVVIQTSRLRNGRRVISHVTEVLGLEEETIITQDLMRFNIAGSNLTSEIEGMHVGSGIIIPRFQDTANYFGEGIKLGVALRNLNNSNSSQLS